MPGKFIKRNILERIVEKSLLFISGCLLAFGIGELLVRLILPKPQQIVLNKINPVADQKINQKIDNSKHLLKNHADKKEIEISTETGRLILELIGKKTDQDRLYLSTPTGRRLRPNTHVIINNHFLSKRRIEIITNSLGLRNREIDKKQRTRILFLGDSITLSPYLPEEETFVRLIEKISSYHSEEWETINAGVKGISLENELAILKETDTSIEPDVVVINFFLNDFAESPALYLRKLPGLLIKSRLIQYIFENASIKWQKFQLGRNIFSSEDYQQIKDWEEEFKKQFPVNNGNYKKDKFAFNKLIKTNFIDWGGAWSEHAWDDMEPVFTEFKELSNRYKFKLAIVVFPVCYQVKANFIYDYPQQQMNIIANRLDIPVLDLLPTLRNEYQESKKQLFYDQCHHTSYASKIIAEEMYKFLRSILNH